MTKALIRLQQSQGFSPWGPYYVENSEYDQEIPQSQTALNEVFEIPIGKLMQWMIVKC